MRYLVMNNWNVLVTVLNDGATAARAARACGGYIIIRRDYRL